MVGVLGTAVSALQAQSQRMAASANNIANASTPGYKALQTTFTAQPLSRGGGVLAHVSAAPVSQSSGGFALLAESSSDSAEGNNVDIATEFVTQIHARSAYSAAVKLIEVQEELSKELLNIKS